MYKSELDKHIQNKTVSNNFIFFGQNHFLIDMYATMLSNIEGANRLTLYHDEYNFQTAKAHLSQASLFGDTNLLIVKSEKKIPKKELDTLLELCVKNSENIFIFCYYGSDHKTYNNSKAFAKYNTMNVRFYDPKPYEAQNILQHLAQELQIQIDKHTIIHLLNIHHQDLALCANELSKFTIYQRPITPKDVDALVFGLHEVNLEEFIEKLLVKHDILDDLANLLEHAEDPIRIITTIASYFTQLYMFHIYIRIHGAPNATEILGYNPPKFVVEKKAQQAIKIKPKQYYKIAKLLTQTELQMKSVACDKEGLLFSSLIRLQKLL